ncbi:MAG: hypothetical protein C0488_08090, partial [Arthrobacter sp.]|nr:hypothetical protein [Arthrobacter sp.]
AALIPLYLGVRVVAARSYARIHRRNLIAAGIVPLILPSDAHSSTGQRWVIDGLADALASGARSVTARVDGDVDLELVLDFSPAERAVLLAGGLLAQVRAGGRSVLAGDAVVQDDVAVVSQSRSAQSRSSR